MSFDKPVDAIVKNDECLNPFRAGRCLSTLDIGKQLKTKRSLNPFRAGRCLSTY